MGGGGAVLTCAIPAQAETDQAAITYRVRIGVGALQGDGINRAVAASGDVRSNTTRARVIVSGGVFTTDGCVVGTIFVDGNGNRVQDPDEPGVPDVYLDLEEGTTLVSDVEGKYSYCGLRSTTHVLHVDRTTLPAGAELTTSSNRNAGNAGSLFIDLTPGEVHRADFIVDAGANPKVLEEQLEREKDISAQRALILSLGSFPGWRAPELVPYLSNCYEKNSDIGIRSAAGWVLGKWDRRQILEGIDKQLAGNHFGDRNWYVSKSGQTFAIVDLATQSAPGSAKKAHRFAIATTEVTVKQFRAFREDQGFDTETAPNENCPVNWVSWYDAAAFCNWLSKMEGLRECYREIPGGRWEFFPDYLERDGYRLPTEQEWEFACRVGAQTSVATASRMKNSPIAMRMVR